MNKDVRQCTFIRSAHISLLVKYVELQSGCEFLENPEATQQPDVGQ